MMAQDAGASTVLEEIIVTAQKREQSLQEVPISISVVVGTKILEQGFSRLSDLSKFVPNFNVNETTATGNSISIRGFSTPAINTPAFEQAVATFVDGVYFGKELQSFTELLDIERVEVLRGPQTTFFGQSAIAGALNILTRKPGLEAWEGYVDAAYGSDADARLQIAYGGPVSDTFGLRFAGSIRDYDGWLTNTDGADGLGQESWTGRVTGLWAPTEQLDVTFKIETSDLERNGFPTQIIECGPDPVANCNLLAAQVPGIAFELSDSASWGGPLSVGGQQITFFGMGPFPGVDLTPLWDAGFVTDVANTDLDSQSVTINYDVNDYTLTLIAASTSADLDRGGEADVSALFLHQLRIFQDYDTDSLEFRVTSPIDQAVQWLAGIYLEDGDVTADVFAYQAFFLPPVMNPPGFGFGMNMAFNQDAEWRSAFASVTWSVSDAVAIDLGVRYIDVRKDAEAYWDNFFLDPSTPTDPIIPTVPGRTIVGTNWNFGTYKDTDSDYSLAARWSASDTTNFYAKFTNGFKSGGFNSNWVGDPAVFGFEPESVDAYEFGLKSSLLDGRLALNVAVFDMAYENLQVTGFFFDAGGNGVFPIVNAAEATSQGVEVDGQFIVNDNLTLGFAGAFLSAEFDSFPLGQCGFLDVRFVLNGCVSPAATQDLSGTPLPFAPDWTVALNGTYTRPVGNNLRLSLNADLVFADCYECFGRAPAPIGDDDGYELLNLRIAVGSMDRKWEVSAYGRNVTDTQFRVGANSTFYGLADSSFAVASRGANYGVQYRYNLGQ